VATTTVSAIGGRRRGAADDVSNVTFGRPGLDRLVGGALARWPSTKQSGRPGKPPTYIQEHTMKRHLVAALRSCKLPEITWYEATLHTFERTASGYWKEL
jgi:hypothetical protein